MLDHTAESWVAATLASIKSPDAAGDSLPAPWRPGEPVPGAVGEKQIR